MKNFVTGIFVVFTMMMASSVQAIPTLFFDGSINYTVDSGELQVSAALTETTDINPAPELSGSSMNFSVFFDTVETYSASCFFCATSTRGSFHGATDALINDLEIFDGNGNTLLTAKFLGLSLEGINGGTTGEVIGLLNATGGSLEYLFGSSDLFALQLGLDTVFSNTMYDSNFTGMVDGNIKGNSVPEPSPLALLCLGLLMVILVRKLTV
ncbi:MAG: PEP-CTERM sorting domain-containing protein [Gammaproteobacteria bacterium]|nr:PEP-CTERM sorting domain-containing protein [Gammaproteobacteria bacterium]